MKENQTIPLWTQYVHTTFHITDTLTVWIKQPSILYNAELAPE